MDAFVPRHLVLDGRRRTRPVGLVLAFLPPLIRGSAVSLVIRRVGHLHVVRRCRVVGVPAGVPVVALARRRGATRRAGDRCRGVGHRVVGGTGG
ncbi:hypothetical protein, partial [Actinoalloteichus caeruleus]|uniref:hypothetical protein n=1 Tax=Actinoalloteichus cyanogriseus TaxID=2893586 RepID=UPI001B806B82